MTTILPNHFSPPPQSTSPSLPPLNGTGGSGSGGSGFGHASSVSGLSTLSPPASNERPRSKQPHSHHHHHHNSHHNVTAPSPHHSVPSGSASGNGSGGIAAPLSAPHISTSTASNNNTLNLTSPPLATAPIIDRPASTGATLTTAPPAASGNGSGAPSGSASPTLASSGGSPPPTNSVPPVIQLPPGSGAAVATPTPVSASAANSGAPLQTPHHAHSHSQPPRLRSSSVTTNGDAVLDAYGAYLAAAAAAAAKDAAAKDAAAAAASAAGKDKEKEKETSPVSSASTASSTTATANDSNGASVAAARNAPPPPTPSSAASVTSTDGAAVAVPPTPSSVNGVTNTTTATTIPSAATANTTATDGTKPPPPPGPPPPRKLTHAERQEQYALHQKNKIYQKMFGVPASEELLVDFSCAYLKSVLLHGRMYISPNYVCFYSNVFGFENKLALKISDLIDVEKKKTAYLFPNAIEITTAQKEYFFASFTSREQAYDQIYSLFSKYQLTLPLAAQSQRFKTAEDIKRKAQLQAAGPSTDRGGAPPSAAAAAVAAVSTPASTDGTLGSTTAGGTVPGATAVSGDGSASASVNGQVVTAPAAATTPLAVSRSLLSPGTPGGAPANNSNGHASGSNGTGPQSSATDDTTPASVLSTLSASSGGAGPTASSPTTANGKHHPHSHGHHHSAPPPQKMGSSSTGGEDSISFVKSNGVVVTVPSTVASTPIATPIPIQTPSGASTITPFVVDSKSTLAVAGAAATPLAVSTPAAATPAAAASTIPTAAATATAVAPLPVFPPAYPVKQKAYDMNPRPPWPDFHQKGTDDIKQVAEVTLPIPARVLWQLFFASDAEYSQADFGQHYGDSKLQLSPWYTHPSYGASRDSTWEKPISAPIGPNSTRVHKISRARWDSALTAFVILSTSLSPDAPYGDYFHVVDRIEARDVPPPMPGLTKQQQALAAQQLVPSASSYVRVRVFADVRFAKSTWLKSVIVNGSHSGIGDFYTQWGQRTHKWITTHQHTVTTAKEAYRLSLVAASEAAAAAALAASMPAVATPAAPLPTPSPPAAGAGAAAAVTLSPGGTPLSGDLSPDKTAALMAAAVTPNPGASTPLISAVSPDLKSASGPANGVDGDELSIDATASPKGPTAMSGARGATSGGGAGGVWGTIWVHRDTVWKVLILIVLIWFTSAVSSGIDRIDRRLAVIEQQSLLLARQTAAAAASPYGVDCVTESGLPCANK